MLKVVAVVAIRHSSARPRRRRPRRVAGPAAGVGRACRRTGASVRWLCRPCRDGPLSMKGTSLLSHVSGKGVRPQIGTGLTHALRPERRISGADAVTAILVDRTVAG